jgi:hypothetical protein
VSAVVANVAKDDVNAQEAVATNEAVAAYEALVTDPDKKEAVTAYDAVSAFIKYPFISLILGIYYIFVQVLSGLNFIIHWWLLLVLL